MYVDRCGVNLDTDRETDRETERETDRDRDRFFIHSFISVSSRFNESRLAQTYPTVGCPTRVSTPLNSERKKASLLVLVHCKTKKFKKLIVAI